MDEVDVRAARAIMDHFPPLLDTMDAQTHQRRPLSFDEWLAMQQVIAEGLAEARRHGALGTCPLVLFKETT